MSITLSLIVLIVLKIKCSNFFYKNLNLNKNNEWNLACAINDLKHSNSFFRKLFYELRVANERYVLCRLTLRIVALSSSWRVACILDPSVPHYLMPLRILNIRIGLGLAAGQGDNFPHGRDVSWRCVSCRRVREILLRLLFATVKVAFFPHGKGDGGLRARHRSRIFFQSKLSPSVENDAMRGWGILSRRGCTDSAGFIRTLGIPRPPCDVYAALRKRRFGRASVTTTVWQLSKISETFVTDRLTSTSAINVLMSDRPPNLRRDTSFNARQTHSARLSCDCTFGGTGFKRAGEGRCGTRTTEHIAVGPKHPERAFRTAERRKQWWGSIKSWSD